MSFRKEKKYKLSASDFIKIKKELLSQQMKNLYPSRIINSCYFDNKSLSIYHNSEEGVVPRKKIRVRWYDKIKIFKKEVKISSIEGRYKYNENLPKLNSLDQVINLNLIDNLYGNLSPKIIVTYSRQYFLFNKLRVTFDSNITYTNLTSTKKLIFRDKDCVMEVKVPINCGDDYIENLLPFPTSRFSKYSRGIEHLNILFWS